MAKTKLTTRNFANKPLALRAELHRSGEADDLIVFHDENKWCPNRALITSTKSSFARSFWKEIDDYHNKKSNIQKAG